MRIGVAATPGVAIPTLDWIHSSSHQLAFVITRPDKPAGRGKSLRESLVSQWAREHEVPCIKPVASSELRDLVATVDLVVTIGYGVILPIEILNQPQFGFINLHFSLLPAWRGAAPVQRAILQGEERTGVSVFALDSGMDTGPIYLQRDTEIMPHENAGELLNRLAAMGPEIVSETFSLIESGIKPTTQNDVGVSYAPKLTKEEARIVWNGTALHIERGIRAFTPFPGAWTTWRGASLRIDRARFQILDQKLMPGEILIHEGDVLVGCADGGAILLEEVTPAGKKVMPAKSWANGARISKGESFV